MAQAVEEVQPMDGTCDLSVRARVTIASLKALADCRIRLDVDGTVFPHLHKAVFAKESRVLRSLIKSVAPCGTITLHDETLDRAALFISLMYDRHVGCITMYNVTQVLELCDKYDLPDVHADVERFILNIELDADKFNYWLPIVRKNKMVAAVERCLKYAEAPGKLQPILRTFGADWLKALDPVVQARLAVPALCSAYNVPVKRTRYH